MDVPLFEVLAKAFPTVEDDYSKPMLRIDLQVRCRFRVQGSGFRVQGSGFRVQGSGFRLRMDLRVR